MSLYQPLPDGVSLWSTAGLNGATHMEIIRVRNAEEGGKKAFAIIREGMENGVRVLGLATGSTPISLYREMTESDLDFSQMISINLDEYVGLDDNNDKSYRYFMNEYLFNKKAFKETYVPNGMAHDLQAECRHYEQIIAEHPIDIQVLGIGHNGHIGFNEPGAPLEGCTAVFELTESTIHANRRFFDRVEDVPSKAVSMGIGTILKAKKMILLAFGEGKADAIRDMVMGPVCCELPASALQNHPDVVVIVDDAAASKI